MLRRKHCVFQILCFLLIGALLLPILPAEAIASQAQQDDFLPVFRFVVTSDVHIRNNSAALNGHEQLAKLYKTAYAYADSHPTYQKLDGLFFLGDNTQSGSEQQQTYFFNYVKEHTQEGTYALATMGNHEFKATGQNYKDPEGATAKFLEYSGYETTDTRFELGGYQFIAFANDSYDKANNLFFTQEKLDWVKKELDAAVAATPDKPIFVMQHEPPYKTMKGSYGESGDIGLKNLLSNYPQVIDFSGHTHCSVTDPRIIWQDSFTAINTGSLAYLSIPIMNGKNNQSGCRGIDEEGGWIYESEDSAVRNAGMYYIVEIDKQGTIRVNIYNMFTESLWGEPFILDSVDPKDFHYTDDRGNDAVKPTFAEDAALRLRTNNYKNLQISIPQATCKDVVQSYRVEVYQGGSLEQTLYRSSMANYGEAAPQINAYIKNLKPDTDYTIKVYATSSYSLDSDPLTLDVTTGSVTVVKADVLDVIFQEDGTAINAVTGDVLKTYGNPTVSYDQDMQKHVATFDGIDDAYGFWGISNWYDVLGTSFTMETYAYLEKQPTKENAGILANLQSAGMGFSYHKSGSMHFYTRNSADAYTYPGVTVEPGSWLHLTGTYDGTAVKFYINGALVAEEAATGSLVVPVYMARCMCIGADSAVDGQQGFLDGKIATARVYSDVLSADQVAQLYNAAAEEDMTPACPEHKNTDTWTEITVQDWAAGGALNSGHYVLTQDISVSAPLTVAASENVCINLAGHNITASGTATGSADWYRVLENNGTLTIMDSAINDGTISGGTVWASSGYAMGGNIYNGENATFNLYGGTISGGVASGSSGYEPGAIGGNIYGAAGSTINIKGGRVENGIATKTGSYTKSNYIFGGNIGSDGTVNISGGTVIDGKVILNYTNGTSNRILYLYGGNIAVRSGAKLNISGGIVADGISTGIRTNNSTTSKSYGRGGNIYAGGADVNITGGVISGGKIEITVIGTATGTTVPATTNAFGANLYIANGDLHMSGGTVSGGIINSIAKASDASTSTAKAETVGYGGNIYITDGVTANITGGLVTGGSVEHNAASASTDGYGGNIYVNGGGILNMSGGVVSDGYAYYRGGNIALKDGSQVNLSGDAVVMGGSARSNGDNVFITGADTTLTISENVQILESGNEYDIYSVTNAKVVIYGGKVEGDLLVAGTASNAKGTFAMYGGYLNKLAKSDVIPDTNIVIYNGVTKTLPKDTWRPDCTCYVVKGNGTYTVWHTGANDGTCAVCGYNYTQNGITMETGKHTYTASETPGTAQCHCGHTITGVVAIVESNAYTTLAEAMTVAEGTLTMIGDTGEETVAVNQNLILDLNGCDIAGSITADPGVLFCIKDSQTDDYTIENGNGYGKIGGTVSGASPVEGYVQIAEADGISYHKVDIRVKSVSLRAGSTGIYYTAEFLYDEVIARNLDAQGVALSTKNPDPVADGSDERSLYTITGNSVLLSNIMRTEKTVNANKTNAHQQVFSRAYLQFKNGTYLYSKGANTSLRDLVETIDAKLWTNLTDSQKSALAQMYSTYSDVMTDWQIDNLKSCEA